MEVTSEVLFSCPDACRSDALLTDLPARIPSGRHGGGHFQRSHRETTEGKHEWKGGRLLLFAPDSGGLKARLPVPKKSIGPSLFSVARFAGGN